MEIYWLLLVIQFAAALPQSVDIKCTFVLLDSYKCLAEGVDVRNDATDIKAIKGAHQSWKITFDVTRLEYVSVWSTFLPNGFSNFFPILRFMEVHDTPIKALRRSNFVGLSNLIALSFDDTKISEIPDDTFEDLFNLQELTLRKSFLKALPPVLFNPLEKLRFFDGKHNMIKSLDRELFESNPHLESVNLSGNPLQLVHLNFTTLKSINEIYLFDCGCVNSYFVEKSSTVSLKHLQGLVKNRCHENI
jgi:Leucine-rich repeat (LRR) protein